MRRSTKGILLLIGIIAAGILYGLYWFYRVPVRRTAEDSSRSVFREADLVSGGTADNGIPSIDRPEFESVGAADQYLKDEGTGLDVEAGGKHRFYPYQILVWHEIANDAFGGKPLAITYSPLTMTGMVFERPGETTVFHVSGSLWNDNLVLVDEQTHSLWSQILGMSVAGERSGTVLTPYPSKAFSWTEWKAAYPRGEVLSRVAEAGRDYTRDPYGNYAASQTILFPLTSLDARLPAKTLVCVATADGARTAYPMEYKQRPDGCVQGFWFAFAAAFPGLAIYQLP